MRREKLFVGFLAARVKRCNLGIARSRRPIFLAVAELLFNHPRLCHASTRRRHYRAVENFYLLNPVRAEAVFASLPIGRTSHKHASHRQVFANNNTAC